MCRPGVERFRARRDINANHDQPQAQPGGCNHLTMTHSRLASATVQKNEARHGYKLRRLCCEVRWGELLGAEGRRRRG